MLANIVINVPSSNVDMEYQYLIPDDLLPLIKVGCRVKVPFGNNDRLLMGYVISIDEELNHDGKLKSIDELVDLTPILSQEQILIAKAIKEDTICPLIRVLNLMVPEVLQLKTVKYLKVNNYQLLDATIAEKFNGQTIVEFNKSLEPLAYKIKKALDEGLLTLKYDTTNENANKLIDKYELNEKVFYDEMNTLNPNIHTFLSSLQGEESLTFNEMIDRSGLTSYMIKKLIKLGFLKKIRVQVSRVKIRDIAINDRFIKPNEKYDYITHQMIIKQDKPFLWIPSDINETEAVIERLVRTNISLNKTTLIICADILSSFKIASLIRKKTKLSVACLNSTLSKGEYYDYWCEIKNEAYRVIVSTNKGALLDIPNLASIILLDCESDNYFNDQSPRYDLKKVMKTVSEVYHTNYILHSYTPNLEEYVNGVKDEYTVIDNRLTDASNQSLEIIDLKQELLRGNSSIISSTLLKKIKIVKSYNLQSLLITNKKYFSSFVMCRSCGEVIKCPRCNIALQYTKKNEQLMCPACSYRINMVSTCPTCNNQTLQLEGGGMEKIVEDLQELINDAKIITIDDPSFNEFEDKMIEVEDNKVDIIIATDTYSRSIYDRNLGLIAILNIDEVASSPNYAAVERAYNLLVHAKQKLNEKCEMVIQTYNPQSFYLSAFIMDDYKSYIKEEINNRRKLRNVPFYQINRIFIKGKYEEVFKEANNVKKTLQELLGAKIFIIGPTYNKTYQAVQLICKHQVSNINEIYQKLYQRYQSSSIMIIIDKYPRYL